MRHWEIRKLKQMKERGALTQDGDTEYDCEINSVP